MLNTGPARWPKTEALFWVVLVLSALDRVVLLNVFGFRFTGDDDGIFWQAARDFGHGIFHEPYFYGQAYNPMLEALLAAPLLWIGVPAYAALPLITSLLALAPFFSFALWHRRHGRLLAGLAFAAIPALLPTEWGMMTMITRGSVTGVAVLAFLPWSMTIVRIPLRYMTCSLIAAMAVFFNPNAAVFVAAACVHLLWTTPITRRSFAVGIVGALPAALLYLGAHAFYAQRPWRVLHHLEIGIRDFPHPLVPEAMFELDKHFLYLCPLWWPNGHVVLWVIAFCAAVLWVRRDRATAAALLASGLTIYASFHVSKTYDGTISPLFCISRMYLAVPLLLGFALAPLLTRTNAQRSFGFAIAILCVGLVIIKTMRTPTVVEEWMARQDELHVPVMEMAIADLREECEELSSVAHRERVELILPTRSWAAPKARFHCYHCPFLVPDFPKAFGPGMDRRWWLRQEEQILVHPRILVSGGDTLNWQRLVSAHPNIHRIPSTDMELHVIENNTLPVSRLLMELNVEP
ncbi:MAG: hypothetical protein ABI599_17960 [Flavobacteriales bacterium]